MLEELRIRDVGVIEDVTLRFAPGLNVLTGETGAGKTMVVSAVELLLGARADGDRVRQGAPFALVEGCLRPPPAGSEEWLGAGDEELVVSREVVADRAEGAGAGERSRARLGGRLAPASSLAATVGAAVEVHGQQDTARLREPAAQRELLDRSGGAALLAALEAYQSAHSAWRAAEQEVTQLRDGARDRAREADRVRHELEEVDAAEVDPGEDALLAERLARLEHAEVLGQASSAASDALTGEGAARDALGAAVAALRDVRDVDPALGVLADRAEALLAEAQELSLDLRSYTDGVEDDPNLLETLRARQALLAALSWKYVDAGQPRGAVEAAGLVAFADQARNRLAELEGGEERLAELEAELDAHRARLDEAAERLRKERLAAGEALAATVEAHLAELAMPDARMEVVVEPTAPGPQGADRVTFLLAANTGEPALPVGRSASGGERSRIALAVRLALADADATPVLVFDEIDAGVGGATALALGRKLAELAQGVVGDGTRRQVLCVTHLAQLAAFADAHFVVAKQDRDGRTIATVHELAEQDRVPELARLLSGTPESPRAAEHAAELRAQARAALGP